MGLIDQVKESVGIIDLMRVTGGAEINEHGNRHIGWHTAHESTSKSSLHVDPKSDRWHCFGCGEGGDQITWMGHHLYNSQYSDRNKGMFLHALREVGRIAGVDIPDNDDQTTAERRSIEEIYSQSVDYFHTQLTDEQRGYLHGRGFNDETINDQKIGYAPAGGTNLFDHLQSEYGLSTDDLLATGLFTQHDGRVYDLFQGRIVFPYWRYGRVVYFIARETDHSPQWERERRMKYKKLLVHGENHPYVSPTVTNQYFYGEDTVRGAADLLATEGIPDAIAAHQAGFACISPGTVQFRRGDVGKIATLAKSAKRVFIVNDNEQSGAGDKGAMVTAEQLWSYGVQAYVVTLPRPEDTDKIDLADYLLNHDADALNDVLKHSKTIIDIGIDELRQAEGINQVDALQVCIDLLAMVENTLMFNRYASQITRAADIGKRDLLAAVKRARQSEEEDTGEIDEPYKRINGRICARGKDGYTPLANFTAKIVADVMQDDGEDIERQVAICGCLNTGEVLPEVIIKANEFESMGWVVGQWGGRAAIEPGRGTKDLLRHAIQVLSAEEIETRHTYTHTGWRFIDGRWVFLHAGGAVGMDGIEVQLPDNLKHYRLPDDNKVDLIRATKESIKLLDIAPGHVIYPMWATAWLPVLGEFITAAFVEWVEGQSGSLKSSAEAVMLNHYGAGFNEYALPADWLGTANSLEKLSFHAKDVLFVVDDFRPAMSQSENRKMQDAAARIIRAAGNRQGRSRLDSGSSFRRTYAPRGVVVSTAERGTAGVSVKSRLLNVDIEPLDIDKGKLADAQAQRHIYSYAMVGFIEWVAGHWDELADTLPGKVADIRATYAMEGHKRIPNAIATVYAALDTVMAYATEIGAIDKTTADKHRDGCYEALQQIAESQSEDVESQDPALLFVRTLVNMLYQGKAFVVGKGTRIALGHERGDKLGWWDGEKIYLLPAAYNKVYKFCTDQGETFPLDQATLWKELRRKAYLAETSNNRIQVGRRDEGGNMKRAYALSWERMKEVADSLSLSEGDIQRLRLDDSDD